MSKRKKRHRPPEAEPDPPITEDVQGEPTVEAEPAVAEEDAAEASPGPVAALTEERDDLLARLQRVSADYLNYQKRAQRDLTAAREFANEELIRSLLNVLDDMERALAAGRENHDEDDPFVAGMQLVHDKMVETLGNFGLAVIEAEGRQFDPSLHAAMMQQPSAEHPPGTVLAELVRGYRLKNRTIRPSGVVVTAEPEAEEEGPPPEEDLEGSPSPRSEQA